MQYNTALCFLMAGLASISLQFSRLKLAQFFSLIVLLIGGLTFAQFLTGLDLQIDQLFFDKYQISNSKDMPGRMAPNTALCFTLSGLIILIYASSISITIKIKLQEFFVPAIIAISVIGLSGYIFDVKGAYSWGDLPRMAIHTAVGFVLLGGSLFIAPINERKQDLLPSIGITLMVLTLIVWNALTVEVLETKHREVNIRLDQIKKTLTNRIAIDRGILKRMAERWRLRGGTPRNEWEIDAAALLADNKYLMMIRYPNQSSLAWAVSNNEIEAKRLMADLPESPCQRSEAETLKIITRPNFSTLFAIIQSQTKDNGNDGCIVAITSLSRLIDQARNEIGTEKFSLTMWAPNSKNPIFGDLTDSNWYAETKLEELGIDLRLRLTPSKEQLASSALTTMVLILSTLLTTLVLLSLYLLQKSRGLNTRFKREASLRNLVIEMAPNAIIMVDKNGLIELVNAQAEHIFGCSRPELLGKSIDILLPDRFRGQHHQNRDSFFANPSQRTMGAGRDLYGRRKDGSEIPLEIGLSPITIGKDQKVLATIVDISERKAFERKLQEISSLNKAILENINFSVIAIKPNGIIQAFNPSAERMLGYSAEEMIDKKTPAKLHDRNEIEIRAKELSKELGTLVEPGFNVFTSKTKVLKTPDVHEWTYIRKDGSRFPVMLSMNAIWDSKNEPIGYFGVGVDISDKKLNEQRQIEFTNEVERINTELNNFTFVASHDLKSPLRGIDQLATWITEDLRDVMGDETKGHLTLLRSRIHRMEMLLDDLLAYSRVGRVAGQVVEVNTREMVLNIFDLTASIKKIKMIVADDLPTLNTFKAPLELVFRNLISNTIKHHDKAEGTITVSAKAIASGYEFSVKDDGPGIPPEHQKRVFDMFQTLKPRDEVEGSGIGLAVVKKSIEYVGGTISIESDGKLGCTFIFTWPTNITGEN